MKIIKQLYDLLLPEERIRALILFGMMLIMALLDAVGVASIMPFIAVLANPELVETNQLLSYTYTKLNFKNTQEYLLFLGIVVFIFLLGSLGFKTLTTYVQMRFVMLREFSIGKQLVEGYLYQPYSWFLNKHSAELGKTVLSEVQAVIFKGLLPVMVLMAQGAVSIALLGLLLVVDPILALSSGIALGAAYGLIMILTSKKLNDMGEERLAENEERFKSVSEAFGAAKEVKVGGLESIYIHRFAKSARNYALHEATAEVIYELPRFALEAVAFGGMLLLILILLSSGDDFSVILPVIALYAFAGYRLMPALQQIYRAYSQLKYVGPSLDALHDDLMSLKIDRSVINQEKLSFKSEISINDVTFTYPGNEKPALKNINFKIQANTTVGFIGPSGSGKTTTMDLMLGLLDAEKGGMQIDGVRLDKNNKRAWQKLIGYVPQQIFLSDDTIAANIAFGVNNLEIDMGLVKYASKMANLHEFIVNELEEGYQTSVGERGIRLSGGQRQRIGIARALYRKPSVLILDEATSALDNLTEQVVMDAVEKLNHAMTIIIVAHRLSTVKKCDQIYLVKNGSIEISGTYQDLKDKKIIN